MPCATQSSATFPTCAVSESGLRFEINANGSIRRIDHGDIMLNLFLGNEADGGLANLYLRRLGPTLETIPLLGPRSPARYEATERGLIARGEWGDLTFRVRLLLADSAPAWFWHVELENSGTRAVSCDLIHTQDIGLAHYGAIRLNEFYVGQYVDHTVLHHASRGTAVASRQNQSMGGCCPWTVIGSLGKGVSFATDALQFHGFAARTGAPAPALCAGLPGKRMQHEHSLVAIQDEALVLEGGARVQCGFYGWFEADKPTASAAEDVRWIDAALALPEARCPEWPSDPGGSRPATSLFVSAPFLESGDLSEDDMQTQFGKAWRHVEKEKGRAWSFFTGQRSHVVLKEKEMQVLRPHGHILRSGGALVPDESALTSTAWMGGVFHSMVTQGHVSINRLLSTCHSYLSLFRGHGQRIFVEVDGQWHLLGVPSAFEMSPDSCRWIYRHAQGLIEVESTAPPDPDRHELLLKITVKEGPASRFLISHHVAMNGDDGSGALPVQYAMDGQDAFVRAIPESDVGRRFPNGGFLVGPSDHTEVECVGDDALIFADGVSRQQPFLCFVTRPSKSIGFRMEGRLVTEDVPGLTDFWDSIGAGLHIEAPESSALAPAARRTCEMIPWFIHNALVHYLSPRGLEQYSGGGWGTRDVCQGPVELLLSLGRYEPVRDLLCRVYRQQNADGDWPQWFMFFDRERTIRPGDSHGDIVYWPLVALAQYLLATGDASLLEERLPFFHPDGDAAAERGTLSEHVDRALSVTQHRVIAGTHLAAYGHGDWNDSLQPARPDMRDRLCSSWTVTLNYQTLLTLGAAFRHLGQEARAQEFEAQSAVILDEFQRLLIVDKVLTGLAYFHEGGKTDHLLHPGDTKTGLSYSLLPMIHAIINDMFTPAQAETHLALIREHLLGPDGAHLFDRPMAYHGGPQKYFQRAESASYFGREIGNMYTHAHLRYCEALARFGDTDAFFHALTQINPIAIREVVASAGPRQANCYYSSSDAAFADRYEAFEDYEKVKTGQVTLEGGWRVYSSGAGIVTRLIMQCFLGLIVERHSLVLDPVIPAALNGLKVRLLLAGHPVEVTYRVQSRGCGPLSVHLNGIALPFTRGRNLYRTAGVRVAMDAILGGLTRDGDEITVQLE